MDEMEILFLDVLKHAIRNQKAEIAQQLTGSQWRQLFHLANIHDVLPLVINSVYQNPGLDEFDSLRNQMIKKGRQKAIFQAQRSSDFVLLYSHLAEAGLKPLVMKGIICRNLYETPELRPSTDEDMLIFPWQINKYHEVLTMNGFRLTDEDTDLEKEDEVSYTNLANHLYLELHKYLFPTDAKAYGDLNTLFTVLEDRVSETIYGVPIKTFGYTDHLLYMICHAYKHVLYSGIGIRQICDIGLFAEKFHDQIDWERIITSCSIFRIDQFFSAIMKICSLYLGINPEGKSLTELDEIDEVPLLEDILSGGLYGVADEDRLHSSTMTLEVVSAQREGRISKGLLRTIFPTRSYMESKYSYVKKNKWLLPVAWIQRGSQYLSDRSRKKVNPSKTIQIGNNRIKLLKKYNIID